jgi:hypothetical protein
MPNIERINRVIEHIEAHPESWDQRFWAARTECGTTHCAAGWAVRLYVLDSAPAWNFGYPLGDARWITSGVAIGHSFDFYADLAADVLDLTDAQASDFFWASNSLEDLKAIRDILVRDPSYAGGLNAPPPPT